MQLKEYSDRRESELNLNDWIIVLWALEDCYWFVKWDGTLKIVIHPGMWKTNHEIASEDYINVRVVKIGENEVGNNRIYTCGCCENRKELVRVSRSIPSSNLQTTYPSVQSALQGKITPLSFFHDWFLYFILFWRKSLQNFTYCSIFNYCIPTPRKNCRSWENTQRYTTHFTRWKNWR